MPVGVPRRDVEVVQNLSLLLQRGRHAERQILKKLRYHATPGFLPERQVQRLDGPLRSLLGGKTRPFVPLRRLRVARLRQIAPGLSQPIVRPVCHDAHPAGIITASTGKLSGRRPMRRRAPLRSMRPGFVCRVRNGSIWFVEKPAELAAPSGTARYRGMLCRVSS